MFSSWYVIALNNRKKNSRITTCNKSKEHPEFLKTSFNSLLIACQTRFDVQLLFSDWIIIFKPLNIMFAAQFCIPLRSSLLLYGVLTRSDGCVGYSFPLFCVRIFAADETPLMKFILLFAFSPCSSNRNYVYATAAYGSLRSLL